MSEVKVTTGHESAPDEQVHHPRRYNAHPSGVEAIDLCEQLPFNVGTALKYLFRLGHKDLVSQELAKAAWYLEREVERLSVGAWSDKTWFVGDITPTTRNLYDPAPYFLVSGIARKVYDADPGSKLAKVLSILFGFGDFEYVRFDTRLREAAKALR